MPTHILDSLATESNGNRRGSCSFWLSQENSGEQPKLFSDARTLKFDCNPAFLGVREREGVRERDHRRSEVCYDKNGTAHTFRCLQRNSKTKNADWRLLRSATRSRVWSSIKFPRRPWLAPFSNYDRKMRKERVVQKPSWVFRVCVWAELVEYTFQAKKPSTFSELNRVACTEIRPQLLFGFLDCNFPILRTSNPDLHTSITPKRGWNVRWSREYWNCGVREGDLVVRRIPDEDPGQLY